jgi:hypothetical protein
MKHLLNFLFVAFLCNACYSQNKIELNLTKGQVYNQKMSMEMGIKQKVDKIDVVINMTINVSTAFTVTDIKDGIYAIDVAYKSLSMKTDIPGAKSMSFDSEKADEKDVLSTSLGLMKDKAFQMKMNRQGKVLEVSNVSRLYTPIFEKFPDMPAAQKQQLQAQIEQSFGEKTFKNNMENMMAFYPQSAVGKGSTWAIKNKMTSANVEMQIASNYKLDDLTAEQYLISVVSRMSSPDPDGYAEMNGVTVKTDINGDVTASMKINRNSGWIDEAISSMTLKGNVSIKANDKLPAGMTIPMEINAKSTISAN